MGTPLDKSKRVPLYIQCEEHLYTSIASGKYAEGEFLPPERTLSADLSVNRLTLRKAIASLIKQGMIENIPGAGNRVRQSTRPENRARVVSCIMLRTKGSPALSPYFSEIFEGLHSEATRREYDLTFMPLAADDLWDCSGKAKNLTELIRQDLAGVILLGGIPDSLAEAYELAGIPVVLLDKPSEYPSIPSVMPDNEGGARLAGEHLLSLGHRRIGYLSGGDDPVNHLRREGLTAALAKKGLRLAKKDV
ncbi:MAG: GntR family transcriptional regulator, partial [Kiritimatiellae bacterium]|nr:GntR family transcriptional regulator [Kiritimatiellia bacterium]